MKQTPLDALHRSRGARMVEFAGYEMPVQYTSVMAESAAVREGAGLFDVSHMARLRMRGAGTLEFLQEATTNDAAALEPGRGQYSLLPNEKGGLVDDIVLYRLGEEEWLMIVNASNHAKDWAHLTLVNRGRSEIVDETAETAMIALQGPRAMAIAQSLSPQADELAALPLFGLCEAEIAGVKCLAARSGYTGEDGFELMPAAADAEALWTALEAAGAANCGLGSRDVLRVEAGLPLYGHELSDDISPIEAGLGWVVKDGQKFLGHERIHTEKAGGAPRRIVGLELEAKRLMQPGQAVMLDGQKVGEVTSGVVSAALSKGIGFALVDSSVKIGLAGAVEMRGAEVPAKIVGKRFLKRK
jgi:aminomethyltransferase